MIREKNEDKLLLAFCKKYQIYQTQYVDKDFPERALYLIVTHLSSS